MTSSFPKITIITGGIGGAKLVEGLAAIVPAGHLSVIGNVGDDDQFHGLWVSPDIDTLTYTLAKLVNRSQGWGVDGDTFEGLKILGRLGQDTWMQLGDRDLAIHVYRTMRRTQGHRPSSIAADIAASLAVSVRIILPTDDLLQTTIQSSQGLLSMEEYFVRERCKPAINRIEFKGSDRAKATPEALEAINAADLLVIAPSNPIVSIGPTLSIPDIRSALESTTAYRVAMSPIIGGKAVNGPSCEMLRACGHSSDVFGVLECYDGLIDALIIDIEDQYLTGRLARAGVDVFCQNTLMTDQESRCRVAEEMLDTLQSHSDLGGRKYATR